MTTESEGWFLPKSALNEPQLRTIIRFLEHAKRAHEIDCKIRNDAVDTWYELDFIKHLIFSPQPHNKLHTEMLHALNACRIMLKNRDQRPEEMRLLDAIKIVIAKAEGAA